MIIAVSMRQREILVDSCPTHCVHSLLSEIVGSPFLLELFRYGEALTLSKMLPDGAIGNWTQVLVNAKSELQSR